MKRVIWIFIVCGILCSFVSIAAGEDVPSVKPEAKWTVRGQSATYFNVKKTEGEADGTAVNDGEFYREELSFYLSRDREKQGKVGFDFRVRATNDEQIDSKELRLLYFRGYRYTRDTRSELGDIAASYNPYVFSTSLKGVKLDLGQNKKTGFKTSLVGGVQKATWQEMVTTVDNEQPNRWLGGANVEYVKDAGQSVALTMALVKDQIESGDYDAVNSPGASAVNGGLDADWRFNRYLTGKATLALMQGIDNIRDDHAAKSSHAVKLRLLTKPLPRSLRSNFTYEYVDPNFQPLVGSGSPDRERFENDTSYHFDRQLKFRMTLKYSRDNLDGQLGETQSISDGTFYCDYRPDFLKRGDMGVRFQTKALDGRGADQSYNEGELYINVRPKTGWRLGGAYIYTNVDDDAVGAVDQKINTLRGTVGWKKRFSNDHLFRSTLNLDYKLIDQVTGDQSKVGGKIDLGYDAGKHWTFDILAQTTNSNRELVDDTDYGAYQARVGYHPWGDASKSIRLTAEQRRYASDSTTSDQTYHENILELSYLFSF
jgi:hypothetical protein